MSVIMAEAREPTVKGPPKPHNCSLAPPNKRPKKKGGGHQKLSLDLYPPLQRTKPCETTDYDKEMGQGKVTNGETNEMSLPTATLVYYETFPKMKCRVENPGNQMGSVR